MNFQDVVSTFYTSGGLVFYTGGYVRDHIMGIDSKDIDLEVYLIDIPEFRTICENMSGKLAGNDFPVYIIKTEDRENIEVSLPRKERSTGPGYKDFEILCDPYAAFSDSCARRDFTMNAMLMDVTSHGILDFYNGERDIKNGILTPVANFSDDPMRVFRALRFGLRFNMQFSPTLKNEIRNLSRWYSTNTMTKERIGLELIKIAEQYNSVDWMHTANLFSILNKNYGIGYESPLYDILPHVSFLETMPHIPNKYHVESTWEHTFMVLDSYMKEAKDGEHVQRFITALYHDVGKSATIDWNEEKGRYTYYNHESHSANAMNIFYDYGIPKNVVNLSKQIVQNHMKVHNRLSKKSLYNLWKEMGNNIFELLKFGYYDETNRITRIDEEVKNHLGFMWYVIDEWNKSEKTTGDDLIAKGEIPGKKFGEKLDNINRKEFYRVYERMEEKLCLDLLFFVDCQHQVNPHM